jgi:hypothetical protein
LLTARQRRLGTAGLICSLLLVAGCGSGAHQPTVAAPGPRAALSDVGSLGQLGIARITSTNGLLLPVESREATPAERDVVDDAISARVSSCMASFGLSWTWQPSHNPPPIHQLLRAYGIADRSVALKRGYHAAPVARQPAAPALTPEQKLVYLGSPVGAGGAKTSSFKGRTVPAGGCGQQSVLAVVGDPNLDPDTVTDQILVTMGARARSDARVVAAITAWSKCIQAADYHFADPLAAVAQASAPGPAPSALEIRIAVADIGCKNKVNLLGIWYSVDAGYENLAIQQNRTQLASNQAAWRAAVTRAAKLLHRAVPPPSA